MKTSTADTSIGSNLSTVLGMARLVPSLLATSLLLAATSPLRAADVALGISTQPSAIATAGVAFALQPVIEILDASGNVSPSSATVTVTASSGAVQGTTSINAVNGIATFSGLSLTNLGNITLTFASTGLTPTNATVVAVVAGPVAQLIWTTQPGNAFNAQPFGTQPVIQTADAYGNPSTNGLAGTNTLSLSLISGSGALTGTVNYNIGTSGSNGVVTFSGLGISAAGSGNQLRASMVTGAFPTNIPNCVLWLDASDLSTLTQSGPSLTTWSDKSGTANNATGGTAPTFATNASFTANLPGLGRATRWDGSTTYLNVNLTSLQGSAYSVVAMEINNSPSGQSHYLGTQNAGTDNALQVGYNSGNGQVILGQYGDDFTFNGTFTAGVPRSWASVKNTSGTKGQIYLNGASLATSGNPANNLNSGAGQGHVGCSFNTGNHYKGDLAEIAVYKTALSSAQVTSLNNYLVSKWVTGVPVSSSATFNVLPAPPTQLVYSNAPGTTVAGATMSSVVVQLLDVYNRPVTGAGTNITVALTSGTGTLLGTLTQATAANGKATFNDLSLTSAGVKQLQASGTGLTPTTAASFTINAAAASQLVFVQGPSAVASGSPIAPALTVQIQDQYGNNRSDAGTNVTISLASGSVILSGTTTVASDGTGLATFNNVIPSGATQSATLQAVVSPLTPAVSGSYNLTGLDVDSVVFTTPPVDSVAGVTMAEVDVTASNMGSPVVGVPVALSLSSGTGTLLGTLVQITDGSGVAHFSDLSMTSAGAKQLHAAGGVSSANNAFNILPAAGVNLAFTTQPANAVAGATISPAVVVQVQDTYGNSVNSNSVLVGLTLTGSGTLSGTTPQATDANGQATFNDLSVNLAGSQTLTAAATGLTGVTSSVFTISAAAAAQLAIVTDAPATATAGVTFTNSPAVVVQDALGNVISNSVASITATASAGNLQGTTTVAANGSNGRAVFGGLALTNVGSSTLTFASAGLTPVNSSAITVGAGSVAKYVWATQPGNATNALAFGTQPVLQTADQYGNPSTSGLATSQFVTVMLGAGTGVLSGTTNYNIGTSGSNGVVTFGNLQINQAGTGFQLAVAPGSGAFMPASITNLNLWLDTSVASTVITNASGVVTNISDLSGFTNDFNISLGSAGSINYTNTMNGNRVVTFASGGSATAKVLANTTYRNTNNTISVFYVLRHNSAATPQQWETPICATDNANPDYAGIGGFGFAYIQTSFTMLSRMERNGQNNNSSSTIDMSGGKIHYGTIIFNNTNANVYQDGTLYNSPANQNGTFNIKRLQLGQRLDSAGGQAGDVPVWNGDISEMLVYNSALSPSQRATVEAYLATKWTNSSSSYPSATFNVLPAPPTQLVYSNAPGTTVAGATMSSVVVQLLDVYNRPVTGAGTNITVALTSGTGTLLGTLTQATAANGKATFNDLSLTSAGVKQLQASGTGLTPTTAASFTINAAAASQLVFVQGPSATTAGSPITPALTVQLRDQYGNNRSDAGTNVSISVASGSLTLSGATSVTTDGTGLATFSNVIPNGGTQSATLQAASGSLTAATSSSFPLTGLAVDEVAFSTQPSDTMAGAAINTVNVTATYLGIPVVNVPVTMTLGSGSGMLNGTLSQITDGSGVAHFTDLSMTAAGSKTLTAISGTATVNSTSFNINAAAGVNLAFTTQPANAVAGVAISPVVVQVEDTYGNSVNSNSVLVGLTLTGSGTLSGTTPQATDANGQATFNDLSVNLAGSQTLTAAATGLTGVTSSVFTISAAAAAQLAIVTDAPATATAGVTFTNSPAVVVQDALGNVISNSVASITATASAGNLQGTTTVAANGSNGRAVFGGLALTNVGSSTLTFASTGLTPVNSSAITVGAGSVAKLVWTTQPGTMFKSQPFGSGGSIAPVLQTADQYGNLSVNGLATNLFVTVSPNGTVGPLVPSTGNQTYNIGTLGGNGVVTVNNLNITATGSGNQLQAWVNTGGVLPPNISSGTLQVWLDGADTNYITFNGGNVSAWNDKSGNGRSAIQTASGSQPSYHSVSSLLPGAGNAGNVLGFNGTSQILTNLDLTSLANTPYAIFSVVARTANTGGNVNFYMGNQADGATDHAFITGYNADNSYLAVQYGDNGTVFGVPGFTTETFDTFAQYWTGAPNTANNVSLRRNGALLGSGQINAYLSSSSAHLNNGSVGGWDQNTPVIYFTGDMAEVIVYTGTLSASDVTNINNYLLSKWTAAPTIAKAVTSPFDVVQAPTTTVLASSDNPSGLTTNVTFTAAVSSVVGTLTGSVDFLTNGVLLANVSLTAGQAQVSTSFLPAGTNTVTANYLGTANFAVSTDSLFQVVQSPVSQTNAVVGISGNGNGTSTIQFVGTVGVAYYVQTTTNLASPVVWNPVAGSTNTVINSDGTWSFIITNSEPVQFFRSAVENP